MTRIFVAVLLIWAQLLACGLQSEFVLCVYDDGSSEIELSCSRCCAGGAGGAETTPDDACCSEHVIGTQQSDEEGSSDDEVARRSGDGECCRDFPLRLQSKTAPTVEAPSSSDVHMAATAPALAATTPLLTASSDARLPRVRERGPPPPDTSRLSLRSVRLRC